MSRLDATPWFHAAVQLLDVRRGDRVLLMHGDNLQVRSLATLIGNRGQLTVVQPDRAAAEAIADMNLTGVEVLAHTTSGDERFGCFDTLLIVPFWPLAWPPSAYGELPRNNLRPGGRFVFDLSGPDMLPSLAAGVRALEWPATRLEPLCGQRDDQLTDILRSAGLRRVQALLGSHLLHVESPYELAEFYCEHLQLSEAECSDLNRMLVQQLGTTGNVDALVHRTRVQGLR